MQSVTLKEFTSQHAEKILAENGYERQRKITRSNVALLENEMRAGRFFSGTLIHFVFDAKDGRYVLVDGQHRLQAVVSTGQAQIFSTLYTNNGATPDEYYAAHDSGKKRSIMEGLTALGVFDEVDQAHYKNQIAAAVNIAAGGLNPPKLSAKERRADIIEWSPWIDMYLDVYLRGGGSTEYKRVMMRAVMFGCGLITFRYREDAAHEFWSKFQADMGLPGSAVRAWNTWTLRRLLLRATGNGVDNRDWAQHFARAWAYHLEGREVKLIRPIKKAPTPIKGTPVSL